LFQKILLARILGEIGGRGVPRDELFGFRPEHSTSLQLARLAESDQESWCKEANKRCFLRCG